MRKGADFPTNSYITLPKGAPTGKAKQGDCGGEGQFPASVTCPHGPSECVPNAYLGLSFARGSGDSEMKKTWFQGLYILVEKMSMVVSRREVDAEGGGHPYN